MTIHFLDAETLGEDLDFQPFSDLGQVVRWPLTTEAQRAAHVGSADVLVINKVKIDDTILDQCPQIRFVALTATGYNNVDLEACRRKGVGVANILGYSTPSVVQHTFALALSLMENLEFYHHYAVDGDWSRSGRFTHLGRVFPELLGKRWGIFGMGTIGRQVGSVAQAFGAEVVYYSSSAQDRDPRFPRVGWAELLETSDVLSIHAPLNDTTRNAIRTPELQRMKATAYLLNLGRGAIVHEGDLAQALDQGIIAGAGLDVMEQEPPDPKNPLLHLKRRDSLILTPHIAWASVESRRRCLKEVHENILAFQRGARRNRLD